ncbi:MAG TPA: TIGR01548 family HAD-type hydrolase [Candidatus Eisenbacteria bacterium]|nr:TIGR01548 family HAD-type hydrolase [Candidatus Eisenbacteria bacterium]
MSAPARETQGWTPAPTMSGVRAYAPARPEAPIDLHLDGNEGVGPPPSFLEELGPLPLDVVRLYPDAHALEALLAARLGVPTPCVMVTAGADEGLDRLCRVALAPGRDLVLTTPTFELLDHYALLAGASLVHVPWMEGPFPVESVIEATGPSTALIAVVTPNNPTGAAASAEDLRRLSAACPRALLLADLAYAEFADEDPTRTALELPNAIVARTLSKAWGLAGLRIGYMVGPERVIAWLRAAGGPYSVAGPSLTIAAARLVSDDADVRAYVDRVRRERNDLEQRIAGLRAKALPSQANFVLARFARPLWVWEALAGLGIAVRLFPERPALEGYLRITCPGQADGFERLVSALETILAPEALLFDLDGVLADVSGSYRRAILETALSFGATCEPADIERLKAKGDANNDWDLTRRLLQERALHFSLDEITERFEAIYQGTQTASGLWRSERLLAEPEHLSRLAARLPLAVVTGRPRRDAERFLATSGIAELVRVVVCMEDGPLKPDPAPVRAALRAMKVSRAWMIGDTPDDVRAARAAGVLPLGIVAPGDRAEIMTPALRAAGATRVLTSLAQLEEILP